MTAVLAAGLTFLIVKLLDYLLQSDAKKRAADILEKGQREIDTRRKEAELELKEKAIQQRSQGEKELSELRHEQHERERALDKRQDNIDQREDQVRKQEKMVEGNQRKLTEKMEDINRRNEELSKILDVQRQTLHELSGLNKIEATEKLLGQLDRELTNEMGSLISKHEKKLQATCEARSREIMITSLQRYAATHTAETTTSTVDIPSDEMKGRIIGREGRNIRAFEKATGVDVIIDDTPGVVIVSGFDMVRREVARKSLTKLIADGRIHPTRIEELVAETAKEMDEDIQKLGEEAAQEAGVQNLHEKIIYLLGRLRFRTRYSQNVLRHSIEVCFMTGMMAEEIGLNGDQARRCGLQHDIGK
ncbi:MAG: Rnase Y domain-containing protein, partial [Pirellulales bacterium]